MSNLIKLGGTTTTANGTGNATNLDSATMFYAYSSAADGLIKLCTADSTTATASIKIGDEQTLLIYKEMPAIKPPPPTATYIASGGSDNCCSSSTAIVPCPAITSASSKG